MNRTKALRLAAGRSSAIADIAPSAARHCSHKDCALIAVYAPGNPSGITTAKSVTRSSLRKPRLKWATWKCCPIHHRPSIADRMHARKPTKPSTGHGKDDTPPGNGHNHYGGLRQ